MYGKIFEQIYDGTLAGNWKALVTFQQMIVLCDDCGTLDMTPNAISGRTGIPLDIIQEGIDYLEREDPYSRTPTENGKRIIRLDDHRPWGWQIVNHAVYRKMACYEDKKKADRERIRLKRDKERNWNGDSYLGKPCAYCGNPSDGLDHITARVCGGMEDESNLVPACRYCNSSKSSRELHEFLNDPAIKTLKIENILKNKKLMSFVDYDGTNFYKKSQDVASCRIVSQKVADVAHTNTDTNITKVSSLNSTNRIPFKKIVDRLNEKAKTNYRYSTAATQRFIKARFNEGFSEDDFFSVIDNKSAEWKSDPKMVKFLRPETLFGTKFESYLQKAKPENYIESVPLPE